jgi:Cu(I)-responsive transcriptional regulator
MVIGQAAEASGVSAKMIRYYEQIGLLPQPTRTESGYRLYTSTDVHTLRFIRRARDLGFALNDIGDLLALWRDKRRASRQVKALAEGHVAVLRQKIAELEAMAQTLEHLATSCAGDGRPECPIIDDLAATRATPRRGASDRRAHAR